MRAVIPCVSMWSLLKYRPARSVKVKSQELTSVAPTACHPGHYFTSNERYKTFLVSLLMAFGITSIFSWSAREVACARMDSELKSGTNSEMTKCVNNPDMETPIGDTIQFAVWSALIQLLFDQFGNFVVSCACVQTCPNWIKSCAEGFGKMAFCVLGLVAITFFISGITFVVIMKGDPGVNLITFVVIRISNFFVITSATQLVMFTLARRGQMKPAAEVLATEAGKKKWENPAGCLPCCPCCMKRALASSGTNFTGRTSTLRISRQSHSTMTTSSRSRGVCSSARTHASR